MIYVDTSVLVALHVREPHSETALNWFGQRAGIRFIFSQWTILEFGSALSRKMRTGKLTDAQRLSAESALAETLAVNFNSASVDAGHFVTAASMVRHHQTGLRSGDALHLAIARGHAARIATLDGTLVEAAKYFGVGVEVITQAN
jgi:uncharacterized protein